MRLIRFHTGLGPGLLESVYEAVLAHELEKRGLAVERQKVISFEYDGLRFDEGLRVDLLVEQVIVVELEIGGKDCSCACQAGVDVPEVAKTSGRFIN